MANKIARLSEADLVLAELTPADQNAALVYLAGLASEHSRRTMRTSLNRIAHVLGVEVKQDPNKALQGDNDLSFLYVPWHALRFQHTALIRSRLVAYFAPATAKKMLSALRGVLRTVWRLGQMSAEDYRKAVDIDKVNGETLLAGRRVSSGEIAALLDACAADQSPAGIRDAAMFCILYACALRRAELVGLDLAHFDRDACSLRVRGKGNKERFVYVDNGALDALLDWLEVRGDQAGPLFVPVRRGGHVKRSEGRLTTQAVFAMLRRRADQAGVKEFSPHDLRRTFATDFIELTGDVVLAQRILGHASSKTTERYDMRGEQAKRKAAELLHVPYRRRE
jgi:site-specific recombinase XerD